MLACAAARAFAVSLWERDSSASFCSVVEGYALPFICVCSILSADFFSVFRHTKKRNKERRGRVKENSEKEVTKEKKRKTKGNKRRKRREKQGTKGEG